MPTTEPPELRSFPTTPVEASLPHISDVCDAYQLDQRDASAVHDAYDAAMTYFGPFNTWLSAHILKDVREAVARDPARRVGYVGRDGHVLAAGARGLDPELFRTNATELLLSRRVAEALMKDHERITGEPFPLDAKAFRTFQTSVSQEEARDAVAYVRDDLRRRNFSVDTPGAPRTLVDNGLRGGLGEVLRGTYDVDTDMHLAVASIAPQDPHPESKKGHLFHLDSSEWKGGPVPYLPDDPKKFFLSNHALCVWEGLTVGPRNTVRKMTANGPVHAPDSPVPAFTLPPQWRNPQAVKAMHTGVLLAAFDHARSHRGTPLERLLNTLESQRDKFTEQIRRFLTGKGKVDPVLHGMLECDALRKTPLSQGEYVRLQRTANLAANAAPPRKAKPRKAKKPSTQAAPVSLWGPDSGHRPGVDHLGRWTPRLQPLRLGKSKTS